MGSSLSYLSKSLHSIISVVILLSISIATNAQIYVDQNASGNNSGTSWTNAYNDLQLALTAASPNDTIRVAQGTYRPAGPGGDPSATFLINNDLVLLGGYNAITGEQNPAFFPTLLSGDLMGDDINNNVLANRSDNVSNVISITPGITNETLIDGFTIRSGHADGTGLQDDGGGIFSGGAPVIRNCTFTQNYALVLGGALLQNTQSDGILVLENCTFDRNVANVGGAMLIIEAPYQISDCVFQNNATVPGTYDAIAGAMYISNANGIIENSHFFQNSSIGAGGCLFVAHGENFNNASFELSGCTFEENQSETGGGGLHITLVGSNANSDYNIYDCDFIKNQSNENGGGVHIDAGVNTVEPGFFFNDCYFSENTSAIYAGAFWANLSSFNVHLQIKNCEVIENESPTIGAMVLVGSAEGKGDIEVDSCYFEGNESMFSGGLEMSNIDNAAMDFTITNSTFFNNEADEGGGLGMYMIGTSQTDVLIENCLIDGNKSSNSGGGIQIWPDSDNLNISINRTAITNNQSVQGGGLDAYVLNPDIPFPDNTTITISNSLIANNQSPDAAITLNRGGNLNLLNTTVAGNSSNGIRLANQSTLAIQNSIFFNLGNQEFEPLTPDISGTSNGGNLFRDSSFASYAQINDLQNTDPLLTNEYRLSNESPAIDKGIDSGAFILDKDLDGNNRVYGCIDIGAFENQEVVTLECANSIKETSANNQLILFPNPATDLVNIQFPVQNSARFDLQIFNSNGQLVHQQKMQIGEALLIDKLPKGWYWVEAMYGTQIYQGKFVKQ